MGKGSVVALRAGAETTRDALSEVIRQGARRLLMEALEAEVTGFLEYQAERAGGGPRLVRNGYLPERGIQTGFPS